MESEWLELLNEKCNGGLFVAWTDPVHYRYSAEAFTNLFQLMTGNSVEASVSLYSGSHGGYVDVRVLESIKPPGAAQRFTESMQAISYKDWAIGKKTGAELRWSTSSRQCYKNITVD